MKKWWIAGAVALCLACSEDEGVVAPATAPDAGRRFVEGDRPEERPTGEVVKPSREAAGSGPEESPAEEPEPPGDPASQPHRTAASPDEPEAAPAPPAGID